MSGPVVVPREDWIRQTWKPIARISAPTPENWIHHSGPGAKTFGTLLGNERYHVVTLDWRGLGYSWAITVDRIDNGFGRVFESRGWGAQGGHTKGRNTVSHGILLVGNWETATDLEITAAARSVAWLIDEGARRGFTRRVVSGGHRQAPGASTSCPGSAGMRVISQSALMLKRPQPTPPEEDEMNEKQDARLRRVEEAVTDIASTLNTVVSALGDRYTTSRANVGSDIQRLRLSDRAIGNAVGAPVNNEGPFDGTTVVS